MNKTRVLYAEDSELARRGWTQRMQEKGYEVLAAEDGQKALETYQREVAEGRIIDLVITDDNMPKIPGWKLIKILRGGEHFKGPIVSCSGSELTGEFKEEYGVVGQSVDPDECLRLCEGVRK